MSMYKSKSGIEARQIETVEDIPKINEWIKESESETASSYWVVKNEGEIILQNESTIGDPPVRHTVKIGYWVVFGLGKFTGMNDAEFQAAYIPEHENQKPSSSYNPEDDPNQPAMFDD